MLGESSENDKKLILVEVSENFYNNLDVLTSCCWRINVGTLLPMSSLLLFGFNSWLKTSSTCA